MNAVISKVNSSKDTLKKMKKMFPTKRSHDPTGCCTVHGGVKINSSACHAQTYKHLCNRHDSFYINKVKYLNKDY